MISVRNLRKVYKLKGKGGVNDVVALNNVSLDFPDKGLVFLLGKSGSGKSTLLNSIGGLDTFDSGEIIIKGKSSADFKQSDFDSYRNTFIGFIFQEYNILEEFTVGKNLALALELQGKKATKEEVEKLLDQVDLSGYYKRKPNQLSGGQKQRVAIARALIKDPEIIMADEPTGALDSSTGKQVMETLKKLSKEKLVIIVSHDREFAEIYGDRVIELKDGQVIRDEIKHEVVPTKSESGVSYIDNSIIHIKKGQQINKDDLVHIGQLLIEHSKENDTIISFDTKSNEDIKKSAFITEEGNREVFKPTQNEDIIRKNHDPKDFKMIRSKLKFKDSFKMGAGALKNKPIRLIFTILLSVVAFTMFGLVDTMASFNRTDSLYQTVSELNYKTLAVSRKVSWSTYLINDEMYEDIQQDNDNYNFHKVINSGDDFYLSGYSGDRYQYSETLHRDIVSGIMAIDESIKDELNLELIEGRLPTAENEICISKNIFESLKIYSDDITSFADIENSNFYISNASSNFKIVGILQDDTDVTKYESFDGEADGMAKQFSYDELDTILRYGLINMCYVNQATFDKIYTNQHEYLNYYVYDKDNSDFWYGYGISFDKTIDEYDLYSIEYQNTNTLTGNQAIVPKNLLMELYNLDEDELISAINDGLTVSFCYDSHKYHAFELDVVGFSNNYSEVYISEELYNTHFKGADYLLSRFKGNDSDKNIINYFEDYDDAINLSIQCPATPVLDDFGGMINVLADILFYVGIALAVFSGLMLMNFISVSISYKKREIGVLRAIGARGKDVFSIFFSESFVICAINFVLSAIACGIISSVINSAIIGNLGVSLTLMMFGFRQIILMLAIALFVAFISCFLPVYKFAKKNPIDCINNR